MTGQTVSTNIYKKISLVMGDVAHIEKRGKNATFNYNYALDTDILLAVRKSFIEHGLVLFQRMLGYEKRPITTKSGEVADGRTIVTYEFRLVDIETGEYVTFEWANEANDTQDKGFAKCSTLAQKYFLIRNFMIDTGDLADDPDSGMTEPTPTRSGAAKSNQNKKPTTKTEKHWAQNGGVDTFNKKCAALGLKWDEVRRVLEPNKQLARLSETALSFEEAMKRLEDIAASKN